MLLCCCYWSVMCVCLTAASGHVLFLVWHGVMSREWKEWYTSSSYSVMTLTFLYFY
ncbi:hypothetical protein BDW69DRAFT_155046 [Aspergillus filifer]